MTTTHAHEATQSRQQPELFNAWSRDQSIIVTYSYYGFVGIRLTNDAYKLTVRSLTLAILDLADLAHKKAMASMRQLELSLGVPASNLNSRGLPTLEQVDDLQLSLHEKRY
ncbi:hypothetical protein P5V30_20245 [Mycobacteroides abscessus subsp. abscessus]|uniref:hypothetical protein n=1 Tax=Mycobacteroides abscessus TaxID=36809 RepID=UPI0009259830|nr:hypothetical protein [Mycobacteroides abscessus]MDO2986863.1 hypothetical protein [Mycobacteroides abscessus subsp. abscessus]SID35175.1 Uncharacterised protein [Mycobacteroides abscessus subsp. abscessus]SIJ96114.1 Uncharacterised protein [Mycobacteroides abscessus subsp. abscessus]